MRIKRHGAAVSHGVGAAETPSEPSVQPVQPAAKPASSFGARAQQPVPDGQRVDWSQTAAAARTSGPLWGERVGKSFPFAAGAQGGLSSPVDFARFLALADPREAELAAQHPLLDDYLHTAQVGEFVGERGVPIRYAVFAPPAGVQLKGVVNLTPGKGESFAKYAELLFNLRDLRAEGYVIAVMDHRGQGFSGRELPDAEKQHVGDFGDYVKDEHAFRGLLERHFGNEVPFISLAHSMGSAIAATALQERPGNYQRSIWMAPMFDPSSHLTIAGVEVALPNPVETALAKAGGTLAPTAYAPGQRGYKARTLTDRTTASQARLDSYNLTSEQYPQTRVGGATWGWVDQAVGASRALMQPEQLQKLRGLDVHLLSAREDALVETAAHDRAALLGGLQKTDYPGAQHELYSAPDAVRDRLLTQLRALIRSVG